MNLTGKNKKKKFRVYQLRKKGSLNLEKKGHISMCDIVNAEWSDREEGMIDDTTKFLTDKD